MPLPLTREQLYDLVWAKPMTKVSEELGISDVMLAKICRQKDVPRPPRGYWASLGSSKKRRKYVKPPLPELLSGVSDFNRLVITEYEQREAARTDRFDWENLAEPIPDPPKPPEESVEEFVARLAEKLPEIPEPGSYKKLHPIAQKIYDQDCQKARLRGYSIFDRPRYQDGDGKRLLEAFNGVLWAFHRLGFKPRVTGRVHFKTHITFAERHKSFALFLSEASERRSGKNAETVAAPQICFAWESEEWDARRGGNYQCYRHFTSGDIRTLVLGLLAKKESDYRDWLTSGYEWDVSRRQELIEKNEEKRQRALRRERARIATLLNRRLELLADAGKRIEDSDRIRELVTVFDAKARAAGKEIVGFNKWSRWALQRADDIDPRHMSIKHFEKWIAGFALGVRQNTPRKKTASQERQIGKHSTC